MLDALGERWAMDLGPDDYGLPGYNGSDKRWDYYRCETIGHNTLTINGPNQEFEGDAALVAFHSTPERSYAVVDMTGAYSHAKSVLRGVELVNGRDVLVVDEINMNDASRVTWNFHTGAEVSAEGQTAMLRQNGKTMRMQILSPAGARFDVISALAPAPEAQRRREQRDDSIPQAGGERRIVVMISPEAGAGTGGGMMRQRRSALAEDRNAAELDRCRAGSTMIRLALAQTQPDVPAGFDGITIDAASAAASGIAAIRTDIGFTGGASADQSAADEIKKLIARAAAINCSILQLPDVAEASHFKRPPSPMAIGDWLSTLVDYAADHDVTLAVVNGSTVRNARMMWNLLERVNHPAIGCCWDVDISRRWGEDPTVSTLTMGSRIVAARISTLGETTRKFIIRLRGIGFDGWVTVMDTAMANATAVATLRGWISPPASVKKSPASRVKAL